MISNSSGYQRFRKIVGMGLNELVIDALHKLHHVRQDSHITFYYGMIRVKERLHEPLTRDEFDNLGRLPST